MKTILHLCADTGSDSKPYADNGYNVILVGSKIGVDKLIYATFLVVYLLHGDTTMSSRIPYRKYWI